MFTPEHATLLHSFRSVPSIRFSLNSTRPAPSTSHTHEPDTLTLMPTHNPALKESTPRYITATQFDPRPTLITASLRHRKLRTLPSALTPSWWCRRLLAVRRWAAVCGPWACHTDPAHPPGALSWGGTTPLRSPVQHRQGEENLDLSD